MRWNVREALEGLGLDFIERSDTFTEFECPVCHKSDKTSIFKDGGAFICYRDGNHLKGFLPDLVMAVSEVGYRDAVVWLDSLSKPTGTVDSIPDAIPLKGVGRHEQERQAVWPPEGCWPVEWEECCRGREYLESRGVPAAVAQKYGLRYSPEWDRVAFPVVVEGVVRGFQARSVGDQVPKVRSDYGFKRGESLMFYDHVKPGAHIIIAEGPIDALKFELVGNFVATMGKVVTEAQLRLIDAKRPTAVYLGLDDDAAQETAELADRFAGRALLLQVPESCRKRCEASNKKADFGECTFEEAAEAFRRAVRLSSGYIP